MIAFRPLREDDLRLLHEWLQREHVKRWWRDTDEFEQTRAHYLPTLAREEHFLVLLDERPVGMIQTYLVSDYPEWEAIVEVGEGVAGVDVLIGDEELVGRGLGPQILDVFVREVVFARAETHACVATVDELNRRSWRAFEKSGFRHVRDVEEEGRPHRLMRLDRVQTWHYGVVAEWWANFNVGGPEVESYGRFVERGQPALDAGCGTGRLLLPWLRAGYDVDGCDVSPDMIELCRGQARADGFEPTLFVQALHELEPPRRYRTIVVCGVFGIASTRGQDTEALRRLHAALEPGGTLVLDHEVPYAAASRWRHWTAEGRRDLPTPWSDEPARKRAADGTEYALWSRTLDVDPLDQTIRLAIRAEKSRDGRVLASEERELTTRMWFRDELVQALRHAGFESVDVRGRDTDAAPAPADDFLVYIARA